MDSVGLTKVPDTFTAKLELPMMKVPFPVTVPDLSSNKTLSVVGVPEFENAPDQLPVADVGAIVSLPEQAATANAADAYAPNSARRELDRMEFDSTRLEVDVKAGLKITFLASWSAPGVTRTPGQQFRKLLLYPPELRGQEGSAS